MTSATENTTVVEEPPNGNSDRARVSVRKTMMRTVQVLVFFFILINVALPRLVVLRSSIRQLRNVNIFLLMIGLTVEAAALLAYSELTRTALFPQRLKLGTLFRIQLATKTVTNLVPGGSAAGSALGYRLLTLAGVDATSAGFALATAGIGSAVILNLLLWASLLISIPFSGFSPLYVTTALVGLIVIALFFGAIIALLRGVERAERFMHWLSKYLRFIDPDRASLVVRRIGTRLRDVASDRGLVKKIAFWATANWILDAIALWVFLRAFGLSIRPDSLLVAFCAANVSAAIPLTPGGLGVIEGVLTTMLALFGAGRVSALGVSAYRLAAYWLPIPLGAAAYFTLRIGRWRLDSATALSRLRDEAGTVLASGETVYDWAERVTEGRVAAAARAAQQSGSVVIFADRAEPGSVRHSGSVTPPSTAPQPARNETGLDDEPNF